MDLGEKNYIELDSFTPAAARHSLKCRFGAVQDRFPWPVNMTMRKALEIMLLTGKAERKNLIRGLKTKLSLDFSFLQKYLSDTTQHDFRINNVYASVDEFCGRIKTLRGFQYMQVDNMFGGSSDIFEQVGTIWGQDLPSKVQLKITYGDIPIHGGGRGIIDLFSRKRMNLNV